MNQTRISIRKVLSFALVSASLSFSAHEAKAWDSYKAMAKEFGRAALRHKAVRVAVLPFGNGNGPSPEGRIVAERLTTQMARQGRVEVVERELLENVMKEQYLQATGAVRASTVRPAGALSAVTAIVTGSVFASEGGLEVHARMIEVESGKVLYASKALVEREWPEPVAIPQFEVPVPQLEVAVPAAFRDALNDVSCEQAQTRLDDLERSVLEVKAAYWASQMKAPGFSIAKLTRNPGSEILDSDLRARFYDRLQSLYHRDFTPQPTSSQIVRMRKVQEEIGRILDKCSS